MSKTGPEALLGVVPANVSVVEVLVATKFTCRVTYPMFADVLPVTSKEKSRTSCPSMSTLPVLTVGAKPSELPASEYVRRASTSPCTSTLGLW